MDTPTDQIESEPSEEIRRKVPLQSVETGKSIFTAVSLELIFFRFDQLFPLFFTTVTYMFLFELSHLQG